MTREQIEERRAWLRGITKDDRWVDDLCNLAHEGLHSLEYVNGSVSIPRDDLMAALNYIEHVGANWTMRGQEHPQKWIVDKLHAALDSSRISPSE